MKTVQSAGIVIYKENQYGKLQYLLLKYAAGHWDFPKGKVDSGENLVQAAYRELQEETGFTTTIDKNFKYSLEYDFVDYDGQKSHKKVTFFLGKIKEETSVTLSDEHTDFLWLDYNDALKKITYNNAKKLLETISIYLKEGQTK